MENLSLSDETLDFFLSVEEAAKILRTTPKTLYVYLCQRGKKGGKTGNRIPENVYIKFGRKTLFKKEAFINWIKTGATMA